MRRILVAMAIVTLINACKKSNSSPSTITLPPLPPAKTSVGSPTGTSYSFGGDEIPGYASAVIFIARDSARAGLYNNGPNGTGPITTTWSATPIH